jgi:PAS domain S-box-containing protein
MQKNDKKTILLVEDEIIIARAAAVNIEKFGYNVIHAENGQKAIDIFSGTREINLVLMDIDLGPGIDGTETAKKILELRDIPVVFLTSHAELEMVEKVRGITRYGYVIKNSGNFVLQSTIEMAFELFDSYKKLVDREKRLLRAEMISGVGSWELNLNDYSVKVSIGARKIYGLYENELNLKRIQEIPLPQYRAMLDKSLHELVENNIPYDVEFEIKSPITDSRIFIHSHAEYNRDENIVTGIIRDISERKQAKETLRRQSDRLNAVMESGEMAWWEMEMPSGNVNFNRKKTDMLGFEFEDFNHFSDFMKLVHPEDYESTMQAMKDYLQGKRDIYRVEYRIKTADGTYCWFRDIGGTTLRNDDGSPARITGLVENITYRKKTEDALRESDEKYRLIADNVSDVIWILDITTGKFKYVSPSVEKLRGFSVDEIMNMTFTSSITAESLNNLMSLLPERLEKYKKGITENYTDQIDQPCKDGSIVNTEVTSTFKSDKEDKIIVIGVSRDVTERKLIEKTQLFLLQSGYQVSGMNFFNSLARFIGENLGMDYVCIDRLIGDGLRARTVAIYSDGKFEDNVEYSLNETPCGIALKDTICTYKKDVWKLFPNDKVLVDMKAESYTGTTLFDTSGKPIGLIAVISRKPKENTGIVEMILKQVGFRVAGELERKDAEDKLLIAVQEADIMREKAEKANKEKEILLREVHHRIKNNMNTIMGLLVLQSDTLKDKSAIDALKDAGSRVQSMMMLYDKLYRNSDFKEISVKYYYPPLITEIINNFPNSPAVKLYTEIDDFVLHVDKLSSLSIIINELLTNIMKYAFIGRGSGQIDVKAFINEKFVTFIIKDNGAGIPESVDLKNYPGFGLQLVNMLTKQIGGTIDFENDSGTRVVIKFKA